MRGLLLLCFALALRAGERTQKLAERLAREADAFKKTAPHLLGREIQELRSGLEVAENKLTYAEFHRFGAQY